MKSKKTVLLILCLIVALCFTVALTACDKNDHKTNYEGGDAIIDEKDMDYLYYDSDAGFGYSYVGKQYQVKYLMKDGSNSYIMLEGKDNDSLVITGHKGAIKTLSLKEIEESVKINNAGISIVGIAKNAFKGNNSLQTADLTKACASLDFNVEESAFEGCTALTTVTLPTQVYASADSSIGKRAFASCPTLTTVNFAPAFNNIGAYAFAGCQALTQISLPDTVTVVREGTFQMCDALTHFSGAKSLKSIQSMAFQGTAVSQFDFTQFASLVYVGANSFESTQLTAVELPTSVTYIGRGAFKNIEPLQEVKIPFLGYSVAQNSGWTFAGVYGMDNVSSEEELRAIDVTVAQNPSIPVGAFSGSADVKSLTITSLLAEGNYNVYDDEGISYTRHKVAVSDVIPERAFYGCEGLTAVSMPDGITEIETSAFENCEALIDYSLPSTLEVLGERAFRNCQSLSNIKLPASLKNISSQAFYNCHALSSLALPSDLRFIGEKAFFGCHTLQEMSFPAKLESIGTEVLGDCSSLRKLTVERSHWFMDQELTQTEYEMYSMCPTYELFSRNSEIDRDIVEINMYRDNNGRYIPKTLTEVTMKDVNFIPNGAFDGWEYLRTVSIDWVESEMKVSESNAAQVGFNLLASTIGNRAFAGCTDLSSLTIRNNDKVKSVGEKAFYNCQSLTSSPLPSKVESIGSQALYGCRSLTSVVFPETVTSYGSAILGDCVKLSSVEFKNSNWIGRNDSVAYDNEYLGAVPTTDLFSNYSEYLQDNTYMDVSESPFYSTNGLYVPKSLTSVTMRGVNRLANSAFSGLSSLQQVTLDMLKTPLVRNGNDIAFVISDNAFSGCTDLKTISVTNFDNVTEFGNSAFYDCRSLTAIPASSGLSKIGSRAFYGCRSITSYTVPETVTNVGTEIFGDCIKLTSLTVSKCYVESGSSSMYGTGNLFSATSTYWNDIMNMDPIVRPEESERAVYSANGYYIPKSLANVTLNSVRYLSDNMFRNWTHQVNITVGFHNDYSGTIGEYAFYNCENANISFNKLERVTGINDYAFAGSNISEFTVSDSVLSLGRYVFKDCAALTSVTVLSNGLSYIPTYTFSGCSELTTVAIPLSISQINSYAFEGCEKLEKVYYAGTTTQWSNISKSSGNSVLSSANVSILVQNPATDNEGNTITDDEGHTVYCVHSEGEWRWVNGEISTELTYDPTTINIDPQPTCTTVGQRHATCAVCGRTFDTEVPALDHNVEEWTVDTQATCTTAGSKSGECTRCHEIISEVIPALEHDNLDDLEWVVTPVADCHSVRTKTCTKCGEILVTEIIPTEPIDLNDQGYCNVCGAHIMHTPNGSTTCATCGQEMPYTVNSGTYTFQYDSYSAEFVSNNKNYNNTSAILSITANRTITIGFNFSVSSEATYDKLSIKNNKDETTWDDDNGKSINGYYSGTVNFDQGEFWEVTLHAGESITFTYAKDSSQASGNDEARIRLIILDTQHNTPVDPTPAE